MEQEPNLPELPYQPLQFILSEVIGASNKNTKQQVTYDHSYHDILTPHFLTNHNPLFYIFFHTPVIYNWLRTVPCRESALLAEYILPVPNHLAITNEINRELLRKSLKEYVAKWQVVKLAFSSRIYVNRVKDAIGSVICSHLGKTECFTLDTYYVVGTRQLRADKAFCKQCQMAVQVDSQIRDYSPCLLLYAYYGPTLEVANSKKESIKYELLMAMSKTCAYIKSANKVWFQVNIKTKQSRALGYHQIPFKGIELVVYSFPPTYQPNLLPAKPIPQVALPIKTAKEQAIIDQEPDLPQPKGKQAQNKPVKPQVKEVKVKPMKQLKYEPNKVIIRDKTKANEYIKQVEQLFVKPKTKDQYELDYDKGKLKKIKEKKTYLQPDFNQIHAQLKNAPPPEANPPEQPDSKHKKIRKERHKKRKQLDLGDDQD